MGRTWEENGGELKAKAKRLAVQAQHQQLMRTHDCSLAWLSSGLTSVLRLSTPLLSCAGILLTGNPDRF